MDRQVIHRFCKAAYAGAIPVVGSIMPVAINVPIFALRDMKELPENFVLISINEPEGDLYRLNFNREDPRILTLRFPDVTGPIRNLTPLSHEMTLKILDFINLNKDKNFLVHCHAGVSRSSAVCLYIHLAHGHDLDANFWERSEPNTHVVGRLFVERNRKGKMNI